MTDNLIQRLTDDLKPAPSGYVVRRLMLAMTLGGLVALVGMLAMIGPRPDMIAALASPMFWIKLAYTGGTGLLALWAVERLSRPAVSVRRRLVWIALPVAAMSLMALARLLATAPELRRALLMGASADTCPWRIMATSAPIFLGLIWALRGLAPTRPGAAGAVAGLAAGGIGAAIYALHCPETAAPFVAIWYSLGIIGTGVIGWLAGPRLLRW
jgi:hypothetical protein